MCDVVGARWSRSGGRPRSPRLVASAFVLTLSSLVLLPTCRPRTPDAEPGSSAAREARSDAFTRIEASALTDAERVQQQRAMAAKQALAVRLLGRLTAAITDAGVPAAIGVCQSEAPAIAADVAREFGLQIGRTSFRLRNPHNTPPAWADDLIDARPNEPAWLRGADGQLAGLMPIVLQGQCLVCHGDAEAIAPPVRAELARVYPGDAATGFAAGDLRGWFWVEVAE